MLARLPEPGEAWNLAAMKLVVFRIGDGPRPGYSENVTGEKVTPRWELGIAVVRELTTYWGGEVREYWENSSGNLVFDIVLKQPRIIGGVVNAGEVLGRCPCPVTDSTEQLSDSEQGTGPPRRDCSVQATFGRGWPPRCRGTPSS